MENRQVDEELENASASGDSSGSSKGSSTGSTGSKGSGKSDELLRHRFVRRPLKIVFADASMADERYAGGGDVAILEGELIDPGTQSSAVFVFMHPSGIQNLLPMPVAMARAGLHVITCTSRYPNNDTCLVMEKVAVDLGACVRHAKEKLGYAQVVLCGWSGGGSLASFYQAQAERPTVQLTPAGDRVSLADARLPPADAVLVLAAHTSRAKIFTEWLDPAVLDEADPSRRDAELDLFDPRNPNQPPYTQAYVQRFRAAQVARNRRITAWAREQLRGLEAAENAAPNDWRQRQRDRGFMVHCTQADIRRLDRSIDPNDRPATTVSDLAAENHSPVGLARFTTLRSWLSQWSYDESQADGPASLATVQAPVLVLANGADHLVPASHGRAMFGAVKHDRKKFVLIPGASHYYFGQKEEMKLAITQVMDFVKAHGIRL